MKTIAILIGVTLWVIIGYSFTSEIGHFLTINQLYNFGVYTFISAIILLIVIIVKNIKEDN